MLISECQVLDSRQLLVQWVLEWRGQGWSLKRWEYDIIESWLRFAGGDGDRVLAALSALEKTWGATLPLHRIHRRVLQMLGQISG